MDISFALPLNPSLLQINTRILLTGLSTPQRKATLSDIPNSYLDNIASAGFDFVWFLGVWQTGPKSINVSRTNTNWLHEFRRDFSDLVMQDITGSPFAIMQYTLNTDFGDESDLPKLRERLRERRIRLILDFVPNHVGLDHPWVNEHPEYLILGNEEDIRQNPNNWTQIGNKIFAHGKDPYFDGWPDTIQLNYRHAGLREAIFNDLSHISSQCDGVRCDMSMLILPNIFLRTWGSKSVPNDATPPIDQSFWSEKIPKIKWDHPNFLFLAEVYWDLEWELQQEGFDYTYDKRLYDRLLAKQARLAYLHLHADHVFMSKSVRFLENHDEHRAASAFPDDQHKAAAIVTFCVPGMHLFEEGQFEGYKYKVSMHLGRRPRENSNPNLETFYKLLLSNILNSQPVRNGSFSLCSITQAWEGNPTHENFIAFNLKYNNQMLWIVVNYGETQAQCFIHIHIDILDSISAQWIRMRDLMGPAVYERDVPNLRAKGNYFDLPAWGYHVFCLDLIEVKK